MTTLLTASDRPLTTRARESLKRAGNPFRNYFARNPDDDVCARYHVPELYAPERDLLQAIIDLYRTDPLAHSEVVPILGNKGAGKTHLLHSIKHGNGGDWQLLVTPGVFQKETDFLEYLLFQIIDTLLGGGKQKGVRPLDFVGEQLVQRQLSHALHEMTVDEKVELFPPPGIGRWARRLGIGHAQAIERAEWLAEALQNGAGFGRMRVSFLQALSDAGLSPERAYDLVALHTQKSETHNTAGMMRKAIILGFARAVLLKDGSELANFLTNGFAELDFQVKPSRQDLVLAQFKVLMELLRGLRLPVVVAFDQLEDLLLARRTDDSHRIAEAFFAGIVQIMHQVDGICVLIFAERGLWNRFVPSLDGYIQDRLNNPVHVPNQGTVKAIRLEAPSADLVRRVVEARMRPVLEQVPDADTLPDAFPFTAEQVNQIARTEPTLRDMLQQFRHLFDHVVYESEPRSSGANFSTTTAVDNIASRMPVVESRVDALLGKEADAPIAPAPVTFKAVTIVETKSSESPEPAKVTTVVEPATASVGNARVLSPTALVELLEQEYRSARRKLEPEGALTGATRELQAGLGSFLTTCHEHGVKVGPWRLQHVVPEWTFSEHPTYGVASLAHWACKDGQPWRVGVGLYLARGSGKPKDLEIKFGLMSAQPAVIDHLILLRPEDDLTLTGKSKTLWAEAQKRGQHARLEAVTLDAYAMMYAFPRWVAAIRESLSEGTPLPNLAELIQDKCERLLEQVCMPVQG